MIRFSSFSLIASLALAVGGCALAPREAAQQERDLREARQQYNTRFDRRSLADLPPDPTWRDVLRRAFLANGDLEAAYHEWAMAVARIQQRGAYPNTPVMLDFEYMFSADRMKSFDRTTVTAGFDPMESLAFPTKVYQAAKVATRDAEAAGRRFLAAKFDLQRRVLRDWSDYALLAEQARVQRENLDLLRLLVETAEGRVRAGGPQQDLLRTDVEYQLAQDRLRDVEAEVPQMRARLNAMLGRAPTAPLAPPREMPSGRPLRVDDATLIAAAAASNPQLAALAREVQGRRDAVELARMQYIPDVDPSVGFTGSIEQFVGLAVTLPTVIPQIQGMIREARADLRRVEAAYRQGTLDRQAELIGALYALRNSERQAALFGEQVGPASERVLDSVRQSYAAGTASYLDLIEAQRVLLDVRLMVAEARTARERSLADLEALAGIDVETLAGPTTSPAAETRPVEPAGAAAPFGRVEAQHEHD